MPISPSGPDGTGSRGWHMRMPCCWTGGEGWRAVVSLQELHSEASPPEERSVAAATPAAPAFTGRHRLYRGILWNSGCEASRSQLSAAAPPGAHGQW